MDADLAKFMDQINDFSIKLDQAMTEVFQSVVIDLGDSVITLSPVLTGRFRGNWQLTEGRPSEQSLISYDPIGAATLSRLRSTAGTLTAGEVAYIVNNLTYGPLIETGDHSLKAPNGVLRVTAARFQDIVEEAVRKHRLA